jgi:hypothetical protein
VRNITARASAGSGEVELEWGAAEGATGYRVLRTDAAGTTTGTMAEIDITTGAVTAADEVTNIWSDEHTYLPSGGALDGPDTSSTFHYVDVGSGERCYRVVATNADGAGPPSAVACGSPP